MGAINLTCRECRAEYGLEARYVCERCFGPLEVGYDHERLSRDVSELRRRIQGGPQNIWRYADFLPLVAPPGPSVRSSSRLGLPADTPQLVRGFARPNLSLRAMEVEGRRERDGRVDAALVEALGAYEAIQPIRTLDQIEEELQELHDGADHGSDVQGRENR